MRNLQRLPQLVTLALKPFTYCLFLLCAFFFAAGSVTWAQNECGPDLPGQDTITCTQANHANGITYTDSDGLTLNLDNPAMTVGGNPGVSVTSSVTGTGNITINGNNFSTVTAQGNGVSNGMNASIINTASTATATVTMSSGTIDISTSSTETRGLFAISNGLGDVVAQMNGGAINSSGTAFVVGASAFNENPNGIGSSTVLMTGGTITSDGHGLYIVNEGLGTSLIQIDGGTIDVSATHGRVHGMVIDIRNPTNTSLLTARVTGGDITTRGDLNFGIHAFHQGIGGIITEMSGGTITTLGTDSYGIFNDGRNINNTTDAISTLTNGSITTSGTNSHGLFVNVSGSGDAIISATGGTVSASGVDADGIRAESAEGDISVTVDIAVTAGSGAGSSVSTSTAAGSTSTLIVNSFAELSAVSGLAIVNNEGDSQTTIANGAQIFGEIRLNNGSDTLEVEGSDISNITIMDGGDDTDIGDGWTDQLIFRNQTIADPVDGTDLINWEEVFFDESSLEVDDLETLTLHVSDSTTTLGGDTSVDSVLGSTNTEMILLKDTTVIDDVIEGAGGADTLSVEGDASVSGGVYGGGDGQDASGADDGSDTITINTTRTVLLVDGGAGDDLINLQSGTIHEDVLGQGDNDTITLNGATVTDTIDGGTGDDQFTWESGSLAQFQGGEDSDRALVTALEYDTTQILDGGDNDDDANGIVDQLTLRGLDIDISGNGNLQNWEDVFLESTTVDLTGDFTLDSNLFIDSGSELRVGEVSDGAHEVESLLNDGTINLQDGAVGDTLTTLNDYSGSGTLLLDVDFAEKTADTLLVNGDVSGSTTAITVQDISDAAPSGAHPNILSEEGILLVDVSGTTAVGDFVLAGPAVYDGAFDYLLELIDNQWLLVPTLSNAGFISGAIPSILLDAFTDLPTLEQRTAARQWVWLGDGTPENPSPEHGVWVRFSGDHISALPQSNFGSYELESDRWTAQTGMEITLQETDTGTWLLGLTAQYTTVDADLANARGSGSVEATGYGTGLTATWYGQSGALDLQGQLNWIESDIATSTNGSSSTSTIPLVFSFEVVYGSPSTSIHHPAGAARLGLGQRRPVHRQSWQRRTRVSTTASSDDSLGL